MSSRTAAPRERTLRCWCRSDGLSLLHDGSSGWWARHEQAPPRARSVTPWISSSTRTRRSEPSLSSTVTRRKMPSVPAGAALPDWPRNTSSLRRQAKGRRGRGALQPAADPFRRVTPVDPPMREDRAAKALRFGALAGPNDSPPRHVESAPARNTSHTSVVFSPIHGDEAAGLHMPRGEWM